ncbi:MAG: hypothetical protein O2904_02515 [bacterium]|nr:hypothetical protein [bacterium]
MDDTEILKYIVIGFAILWIGICNAMAYMSGWKSLARKYPALNKPMQKRYFMQDMKIRWATYKNGITIRTGPEGIYFSMFPVFRFGHTPFLIPWYMITKYEKTTMRGKAI